MDEKPESIVISDTDFDRFQEYFYRETGIRFGDGKRYFVDRRLIQRMEALGIPTLRSYLTMVKFQTSRVEYHRLVDLMTVNETYFFREAFQLDCIVNHALDEVLHRRKGKGPIRIWSIPCSSGEEPYSIAIHLLENWPRLADVDVEIVAADINATVLDMAREGIYGDRALQNVSARLRTRYFHPCDTNRHVISPDIREVVSFRPCNLTSLATRREFFGFDIVLCRNLLIYFDKVAQVAAIENLFSALVPGGLLFLGHSESMSRISSIFGVRKFPETIAYQRPVQ